MHYFSFKRVGDTNEPVGPWPTLQYEVGRHDSCFVVVLDAEQYYTDRQRRWYKGVCLKGLSEWNGDSVDEWDMRLKTLCGSELFKFRRVEFDGQSVMIPDSISHRTKRQMTEYIENILSRAITESWPVYPPDPDLRAHKDPDVNAAKKRFAEVAAKTVGIDRCAPEFLRNVLKQTQTLTGSTEIGVCADWLSEHGRITDGVVTIMAEDGQADANQEPDGVRDGTEAEPALFEDEGGNRTWKYTCDGCGMGYTVLPANGTCMSRDDDGYPNCPGKVGMA